MNAQVPDWALIQGDAADMRLLGDGEADLVVTSPPYFSHEDESLLAVPVKEQREFDRLQAGVTRFAFGLRPQFREIARVLRPGGALVLQTKDLRYGGFLLTLAGVHREVLEGVGLRLVTRVFWRKRGRKRRRSDRFLRRPLVGLFETDDVEEFLILSHVTGIQKRLHEIDLPRSEAPECASPLWDLPGAGGTRTHPYQSPPAVIRRFIHLFSIPGDLVVDPFAGHGTTLR